MKHKKLQRKVPGDESTKNDEDDDRLGACTRSCADTDREDDNDSEISIGSPSHELLLHNDSDVDEDDRDNVLHTVQHRDNNSSHKSQEK
jgi:hypothetical protein